MTTLYLVLRRTWYDHYSGLENEEQTPGGTPVASFLSRPRAEALCRRLEMEARESIASPFLIAEDPDGLTTLAENLFLDRVRALGLIPPEGTPYHGYVIRNWAIWYDTIADQITPEQCDGLWDLLDRARFYQVVETELDPSGE